MTSMHSSEMRYLSDAELEEVAGGIGPAAAFALGVAAGAAVSTAAFVAGAAVAGVAIAVTSGGDDESEPAMAPGTDENGDPIE